MGQVSRYVQLSCTKGVAGEKVKKQIVLFLSCFLAQYEQCGCQISYVEVGSKFSSKFSCQFFCKNIGNVDVKFHHLESGNLTNLIVRITQQKLTNSGSFYFTFTA